MRISDFVLKVIAKVDKKLKQVAIYFGENVLTHFCEE